MKKKSVKTYKNNARAQDNANRCEREKVEEELRESEERLRKEKKFRQSLIDTFPAFIVAIGSDGQTMMMNQSLLEALEYTKEEIKGTDYLTTFVPEEDRLKLAEVFQNIIREGKSTVNENRIISRSGRIYLVEWHGRPMSWEERDGDFFIGIGIDITARKQMGEALRQSEEKYRTILEDIQEGYFEVDFAGNFTFFNDSLCRFLGYSKEELMGMNNRQYTDKENSKKLFQAFNKVYNTGGLTGGLDWQVIRKDGTKRYVEASISLLKDSSGKPKGFRGIARDVTERKKAEEELKKEQLFNVAILDSVPGILYLYDETGHLVHWNKQYEEVTGYSSEELRGMYVLDWFGGLEPDTSNIINGIATVMKNGHAMTEARIITKSGHAIPMILTGVKLVIAGKDYLLGIGIDITDRKKAEEALKNSEVKYRNIFENAIEGIYQSTIEGRIITANAALARMSGYDSPEELMESVKDIGTQLYVHPEDRKRFLEIRKTKGFVDGFEVEFYKKDGSIFWAVINARTVKDEQGKILYIEGLIEDITIRKNAEEQLHQTLDSLRKSVGATIQVMVSAVEMRDPYTAGHQIRTADLARAIATEMGLPKEKIDGIRMAGSIHDIGKISIPAEILTKPIKLTNIEFSLIKEHSHSGYEMLKDVESPWPLAQIVYQHHERMDGSGYPRNLKGDEIIIEARIMAVADVVEAMASHRPYRPGLGIDAALAEIEKNKGTHYDNTVAAACLRLFRERGYQFK
jgi:PAS domain S-box-containing protein